MFWIVLIVLTLAALAFNWISFQRTRERILIGIETEKIKQALGGLMAQARELIGHGLHR